MPNRRATSMAERGEIAAHRQAALLRMIATDPLVRRGLRHVVAMTGAIPGLRDVVPETIPRGSSPRAAPARKEHTTTTCATRQTTASSSTAAPSSRAQRRLERVLKHKAALVASDASAPIPVDAPAGDPTPADATVDTPHAAKRPAGVSPSWAVVVSTRPPPALASDRPNIGVPMG